MNLRNNNWKKIVQYIIWLFIIVFILVFVIRVTVFERNYLNEKEGSERAEVAAPSQETEELIEVKPTEQEIYEYKVAPERPRYLTIVRLGVYNARILPMGVNEKGELDTPYNIFDVGWYTSSGLPGLGGTMVMDGHNGGPHVHGVFKNLPSLGEGDLIIVERGDGVKYTYSVVENESVLLSEADRYMSVAMRSPERGKESVTLITCTGEWSEQQGTYLSRQFTRAVLVEE